MEDHVRGSNLSSLPEITGMCLGEREDREHGHPFELRLQLSNSSIG